MAACALHFDREVVVVFYICIKMPKFYENLHLELQRASLAQYSSSVTSGLDLSDANPSPRVLA